MLELNAKFSQCGMITPDCNSLYIIYKRDEDGLMVYDDTDSGAVVCLGDIMDPDAAYLPDVSAFTAFISKAVKATGLIGLYMRSNGEIVGFWKKGDSVFTATCTNKENFTIMPEITSELDLSQEISII